MLRKIIHIDEDKCNGCGLCAKACHEGAIEMINGKAKLTRENFCDGFGDCLPECPTGAITFEEREVPAYDENAVKKSKQAQILKQAQAQNHAGCPGSAAMFFDRAKNNNNSAPLPEFQSQLTNWPVQVKLLPSKSDFYENAEILLAADCTAYAYANFHEEFIKGKTLLIACPKLDMVDYSEKLAEILKNNNIKGVTLVRMEVPCCGGLERMLNRAVEISGKNLKPNVIIITRDGRKII